MTISRWSPTRRLCKVLFARAVTCAFPGCGQSVVEDVDGELTVRVHIAHIRGRRPGSARYYAELGYAEEKVDSEHNTCLLCPPHHDEVDGRGGRPWTAYPVEELQHWKDAQVAEAGQRLTEEQLEIIVKALTEPKAQEDLVVLERYSDFDGAAVPLRWYSYNDSPNEASTRERHFAVEVANTGLVPFDVANVGFEYECIDETDQPYHSEFIGPPMRCPSILPGRDRLLPQQGGCWEVHEDMPMTCMRQLIGKAMLIPTRVRAKMRIGGGDVITGEWLSILHLPGWKPDVTEHWLAYLRETALDFRRRRLGR